MFSLYVENLVTKVSDVDFVNCIKSFDLKRKRKKKEKKRAIKTSPVHCLIQHAFPRLLCFSFPCYETFLARHIRCGYFDLRNATALYRTHRVQQWLYDLLQNIRRPAWVRQRFAVCFTLRPIYLPNSVLQTVGHKLCHTCNLENFLLSLYERGENSYLGHSPENWSKLWHRGKVSIFYVIIWKWKLDVSCVHKYKT